MTRTLLQQAFDALHPQANRAFVEATKDALRAALAQPEPIDGFGGNLDDAFDAPAPAVPNGAVPPGSWEHLKVMMQHSAWEGTLQLCDALANIEDFAKSAAPAVPDNIADLLEDYVMARVETALFNNHVWPQGTPVRMAKPRKDKLMSAIGASLSAAPAVPPPIDNRFVAPGCEQFGTRADAESLLAMLRTTLNEYMRLAAPAPAVPDEMSPEFTDTARNALLWVLWHHQGGSSAVGQPIRFALGMDAHERLSEHQIAQAKKWAAATGSTTAEFHTVSAAPAVPLTDRTAQIVRPLPETMSRDEMLQHYSAHANLCAHEALQYQKRIRDLEKALSAAPAVREPKHTETSRLLANVADAARRLVEHADFQLGGILSADSKAKDIPSKAVSQVKARHLASLRDRIAELDAAHGIGGGGK